MYSFNNFGLRQMIESGKTLRQLGAHSRCMEEVAREIVDFFYDSFRLPSGEPACALARCFKTHRFSDLPKSLREATLDSMHGAVLDETVQCLTLLATRGTAPEWNDRRASLEHRSIPLTNPEMVAKAPMIARLIEQMGLHPHDVLYLAPESLEAMEKRTLDVFHIENAVDSTFVPAQAGFVKPYGVRSVLGFGGLLPSGDFFFFLLFSRESIDPPTAALFRTLAINIKLALLEHLHKPVFVV